MLDQQMTRADLFLSTFLSSTLLLLLLSLRRNMLLLLLITLLGAGQSVHLLRRHPTGDFPS
jgi:hypothetical protein